jgi:tRNA threonylcarbamoyladenosine biosynthesis protein TsaB
VLLAIDTSTRTTGVALYNGVSVLAETIWADGDTHTVELAPAVAEILSRAGITIRDIEALGIAAGPGSFTGLRIGMALAKGIALVRRVPLIAVPTLDILAAAQHVIPGKLLAATLRVGRGRLAVGWYEIEDGAWKPNGESGILTAEALASKIARPTLVCGEFEEGERRLLARKRVNVLLASPAQSLRRPSYLAELAWTCWQEGQVADPATLAPFYMQQEQISD